MLTQNFDLTTVHTTIPRYVIFTEKTGNWGIHSNWI